MNDLKSSTKAKRSESTADRLTEEERAAIKDRAAELKAAGRGSGKNNGGARPAREDRRDGPEDRAIAERLRAIIADAAPGLTPKTWYGMPAWARDGKVVCFFQPAQKFKTRYATFGFDEQANLDDGAMWPTTYALTKLGEAEEAALTALIKKAVS